MVEPGREKEEPASQAYGPGAVSGEEEGRGQVRKGVGGGIKGSELPPGPG